jgi:hypothetical protein
MANINYIPGINPFVLIEIRLSSDKVNNDQKNDERADDGQCLKRMGYIMKTPICPQLTEKNCGSSRKAITILGS